MEHSTQAIILAGGKGTRLAPLTADTPKPMLTILGKRVLAHILEAVAASGITNATVTTGYLASCIEAYGSKCAGTTICYTREETPLGTAGAARLAYDGKSDTILVLCGDGLFDFDLNAILAAHREKGAAVTVVSHKCQTPLAYGVLLYGDDGRITSFCEKPPWAKVTSGTVNTGIYVLNKDIIARIPSDTPYDFAKDLFPRLMAERVPLYAYEAEGSWYDIGSLDEYFSANCAALDGKITGFDVGALTQRELEEKQVHFTMPVYVSRAAILGQNVRLGAYTVIGDSVVVNDNCDIAMSIIGEGTVLGTGSGVYGSIFGKNCRIGENCVTSDGCVIGSASVIEDGVILPKYAFLREGTHLSTRDNAFRLPARRSKTLFCDEGLSLAARETSPAYLLRVGEAAALAAMSVKGGDRVRIGIMDDDLPVCRRFSETILAGIRATGAMSFDFGKGFAAMARFAALTFLCDVTLHISMTDEKSVTIRFFDERGLRMPTVYERAYESAFFSADDYTPPEAFYEPERTGSLSSLYESALYRRMLAETGEKGLTGVRLAVGKGSSTDPGTPSYMLTKLFYSLGATVESEQSNAPVFYVSDDGTDGGMAYRGLTADKTHLDAIWLAHLQNEKTPVPLESTSPQIYRELCAQGNIPFIVFNESDTREVPHRASMVRHGYLYDALLCAGLIACLTAREQTTPEALIRALPAFAVRSTKAQGGVDRAGVMRRLSGIAGSADSARDGVQLVMTGGRVTVIPGKAAGFRIISEARSAEAASELCERATEMLQE